MSETLRTYGHTVIGSEQMLEEHEFRGFAPSSLDLYDRVEVARLPDGAIELCSVRHNTETQEKDALLYRGSRLYLHVTREDGREGAYKLTLAGAWYWLLYHSTQFGPWGTKGVQVPEKFSPAP